MIQAALADPANIGFVKGLLGLSDLVVPGEDSRNKQLREIDLLLAGAPVARALAGGGSDGPGADSNSSEQTGSPFANGREDQEKTRKLKHALLEPSVPIDLLFDNHAVELEECRRWANSDAGQIAHVENPAGFENVRAHAAAHLQAIGLAYAAQDKSAANAGATSEQDGSEPAASSAGKNRKR